MRIWKTGFVDDWIAGWVPMFGILMRRFSNVWKQYFQGSIYSFSFLVLFLFAGQGFAEDEATRILDLMDAGQTNKAIAAFEMSDLEGAAKEVVLARLALGQGQFEEAMRHLAWVQVKHYRETDWLPVALYVEVLADCRMGADGKTVSAMDELKQNYPTSDWCRRAEEELNRMEKEEGAFE